MKDIDVIYRRYVDDDTIISTLQLASIYGITNNRELTKFRNLLYDTYGKEHIKSIGSRRRGYLNGCKNKKYKGKTYEDMFGVERANELKRIKSESNKKAWERDTGERREKSRQSMIDNVLPIASQKWVRDKAIESRKKNDSWANYSEEGYQSLIDKLKNRKFSEDTRKKMSESAIKRGYNLPDGFKHSDVTKNKLSEITKKQWIDGIHKPKFKSNGHIEIENILINIGYEVVSEYLIGSKPYDIYISKLNIIIEYNGTYWHYDPRKYDSGFYDKSMDRYVDDVWEYDKNKIELATAEGYNTFVVWQLDYEALDYEGRINFIKNVIKHDTR